MGVVWQKSETLKDTKQDAGPFSHLVDEARKVMADARAATQAPAGWVCERLEDTCIGDRFSFIVDSTLRKVEWGEESFNKMHRADYRVLLIFVDAAVDVCQERVIEREKRIGRPVGSDFVAASNEGARSSAMMLKHRADEFVTVSNSACVQVNAD